MAEIEPRGRDFGTGPGFLKRYPEVISDLGFYNGSSLTVMNGADGPFIRCVLRHDRFTRSFRATNPADKRVVHSVVMNPNSHKNTNRAWRFCLAHYHHHRPLHPRTQARKAAAPPSPQRALTPHSLPRAPAALGACSRRCRRCTAATRRWSRTPSQSASSRTATAGFPARPGPA
jgi:hypothetical protein